MKAGELLNKLMGKLPEVALEKAAAFAEPPESGRPDDRPDLPEQALGRPMGPPEETPAGATPDLPDHAMGHDPHTGLPYVAMESTPDGFPGEAERPEEAADVFA